jgi:DNA-binding transcriptional regulator YdaS (Cro superfamily)
MEIRDIVQQCGGATVVATQLGVTRQAVWNWINRDQVGSAHAWKLAKLAKIKPTDIRPDVFGKSAPAKVRTGAAAPKVEQGEGETSGAAI